MLPTQCAAHLARPAARLRGVAVRRPLSAPAAPPDGPVACADRRRPVPSRPATPFGAAAMLLIERPAAGESFDRATPRLPPDRAETRQCRAFLPDHRRCDGRRRLAVARDDQIVSCKSLCRWSAPVARATAAACGSPPRRTEPAPAAPQGSASNASPKPARSTGMPMPSSGVANTMKVASLPVRQRVDKLLLEDAPRRSSRRRHCLK